MRTVLVCTLLSFGCATAKLAPAGADDPAGSAAAGAPRLVSLDADIGVYEPEMRDLVLAHLPSVAPCLAFALQERGSIVPLPDPATLDDRTEVQIAFRGDEIDVHVRSLMSDPLCVQRAVERWPFTEPQRHALQESRLDRRTPPLVFRYRYHPDAAERERQRQQNAEGLAAVCTAMAGASRDDVIPAYQRARATLSPRVQSELDAVVEATAHAFPADRATIFASAYADLASLLGAPPDCAAFKGWKPLPE